MSDDATATTTTDRTDEALTTKLRHAGAAIAAGLGACLYYALDRSQAAIRHGAPDPLSMTTSHRIDYFWRIAISAFLATMVYGVWVQATRGREARAFDMLARALVPVVAVCALLAMIFP